MPANPKVFLGFAYAVPAVHRGVVRCARERRWDLQTNANNLAVPAGARFDGVLLQYGADPALDALAHAHPGRVVDLTRRVPEAKLHRVFMGGAAAGEMAARHLMSLGHRAFALVAGRHWADPVRRDVFMDTLAAAGFPCAVWSLDELAGARPEFSVDSGEFTRFLRDKLAKVPGQLAVFCLHDSHADLLLRAARELDFSVPGRLAVLGCDNDELICECAATPLSSIDPNFEAIGYEAALRLDALMCGDTGPVRETGIPPRGIVERLSTGCVPADDPVVRQAMALIAENAGAITDVATLARAVGVNRRSLERAFRTSLGKSPLEHLIELRVERAARFMRENPGLGGPVVSEKLGYASVAHFYRQFSKVKGVSVEEFRRRFTARGAAADRKAPGSR